MYCNLTLENLRDHPGEGEALCWVLLTMSKKRGFCWLGINPWQMVGWEKSVSRENTEDRMLELLTKRRLLPTASRAVHSTGSPSFPGDPARA